MAKRNKKPVKLYTIDTETYGLGGDIRRIAVYDGIEIRYGYTFEDIEPFLIEESEIYDVHVYIHNLDFDARKLNGLFRKGNVLWNKCLIINRRYAKISCEHYNLHDSFMLLPMSLAQISKDFDLEHGKLDLWEEVQKRYPGQYENEVDFFCRCDKDDPLYLEYLGYDVLALYEFIEKLCKVSTIPLEDLVKCPSTASMSKYIFKHGYQGKPIQQEGRTKPDYEYLTKNKYWQSDKLMKGSDISWRECEYKMRDGYFGGRCEVFKNRLERKNTLPPQPAGFYYDVNSLYPAACESNDFPIGVPEFYKVPAYIEYKWRGWLMHHNGLGFIKCKVFVPKQKIPPLPVRREKLCFFCGYMIGTWTYVELEYAVKNCGVKILEFIEMIHFEETYPVYREYMQIFYNIKETAKRENNGALYIWAKFMMNTAYGWTCMSREDKSQYDFIEKAEKYESEGRLISVNEDLYCVEYQADIRAETIQVQIGAYVTSYARLILLEALRKQAESGNVYYCDTDSIVCDTPLPPEMVDEFAIGKWDLENELIEGIFIQPKVYTIITTDKTKFKFKGVTKNRRKHLDFDFYEDILSSFKKGDGGRLLIESKIERLPSLITAQKRGKDANEVKILDRNLNLENIQKRDMNYKNNNSEPWFMHDFEFFENFTFVEEYLRKGDFFAKRRTDGATKRML